MPIGVMDFPLLTPQQTSPLGGVLSDAIAKRLAMAKTQAAEESAPYAGIGALSKALSESAYAGAVTPQFQSKLLENIMTASNIPEPEKKRLLSQILNYGGAGIGGAGAGSSSNPAINKMQQLINQKLEKIANPPQSASIGDLFKGIFGGGQQSPNNNVGAMPQNGQQPVMNQPAAMPSQPPAQEPAAPQSGGGGWFENVGQAKGTIAQGEKEGGARGEAVAQYGKDAKAVIGQQRASKQILSLLHDDDIKGMIQIPFFNKTVKSAYEQAGNKTIQEKIGRLDAAINNYITASPQRTDADKDFLISQKPNVRDPLPVKLGKLAQLEIYNEAYAEQIRLSNKYVRQGYDQTTAELMASKEVDVESIEKKVNKEVFGKRGNKNPAAKANASNGEWGHLSNEELERYAR